MLNRFAIASVAAACSLATASHAQGLTGSQVTGAIYCCQAPTEEYRGTNFVTAAVGPDIEFPDGAFTLTGPSQISVIPVEIDIGASTIDIRFTRGDVAASGAFNGYVFDFTDAPEIASVSLDALSTVTPANLSWDANTVFVSVAALSLPLDSHILLNVSPVPEPKTYALLLGGVALLGLGKRLRQRASGPTAA